MKIIVKDSILDLSYPHVMGVLNLTPDSFYDGGVYNSINRAIKHVNLMINFGATIIDIGGESTRPGALPISTEEELSRIIPIIQAITQRFDIWISINTSNPKVMRESAKAGALIINDVRAFSKLDALKAAAETGLSICLMHMQGQPSTMQINPEYTNIITEINSFFIEQIIRCENVGIMKDKIILDPGFGFGKNLSHNYKLLAYLSYFHHFNLPLLVGFSRKSMIRTLLNVNLKDSLNGSIVCAVIALMQGARIIRVHDVKETMEAIRIVKAILLARENGRYYE